MTSLVNILMVSLMMDSVFGLPGEKVKRGFNSDYTIGQGDPEGDEQNASVSNENDTDCNGYMRQNEDSGSHEIRFDSETPFEGQHSGHSFSKTSATSSASASSSAYNLKNQNNVIPK